MDFRLERRSAFSFSCHACGRCCTGKIIMAGPHEVLGISRLLGMSTTEFLALYTDNSGTTLRFGEDGRCVFLTASGCRVHPRRPLVCRLYPLGRATDGTGDERFALFPKQAGCEAEIGTDGTIADFLESQGVAPYIEWSRHYGELYRRMIGLLDRLDIQGKVEAGESGEGGGPAENAQGEPGPAGPEQQPEPEPGLDSASDRAPLSGWQDIDASLDEYCAVKGIAMPEGIDESIALHLLAIGEWLDDLESRPGDIENDPGTPEGGSTS